MCCCDRHTLWVCKLDKHFATVIFVCQLYLRSHQQCKIRRGAFVHVSFSQTYCDTKSVTEKATPFLLPFVFPHYCNYICPVRFEYMWLYCRTQKPITFSCLLKCFCNCPLRLCFFCLFLNHSTHIQLALHTTQAADNKWWSGGRRWHPSIACIIDS